MQESRRIQKTGGSTYTISLPKRWITESGLKKGDLLSLTVGSDGTLTVGSGSPKESEKLTKEILVDNKTDPQALMRQLVGVYVTGHDVIHVRSNTRMPPEVRKAVQDFSRRVIGPEIIEESSNHVVVHDVADHADLAMRKVVRRMHLMVKNMFEEAVRAVENMDTSLAEEVIARDDEVDRLHWFVEKQHATIRRNASFATKMKMTWLEADVLLSTAKSLERIADHAVRVAHSVRLLETSKLDRSIVSDLERLSMGAISVLDDSVEALFRSDSVKANECLDRSGSLQDEINKFVEGAMSKRGKVAVGLAFAAESVSRACGYSSDIAETVINLAEGQ